jgi:hypothetical protein
MKNMTITLSDKQHKDLVNFNLESFAQFGIGYAVRNELQWWSHNILDGVLPTKVDRIKDQTYFVKF